MIFTILLGGIIALLLFLVLFGWFTCKSHANYFKKKGTPYMAPGLYRLFQFLTGSTNFVKLEMELYKEATEKGPVVGTTDFFASKGIYVTDLDVIKSIYIKDFDHFINRRSVQTEKSNLYFKKMLFAMEGEQWKGIRAKLSPTFTTGKIKRMFGIFSKSGDRMSEYLKVQVGAEGQALNFDLVFPKFAMDVIASCAFGIDSKCFEVPPENMSIFEEMGKKFQFNFKPAALLKFIIMTLAPKVADFFKLEVMDLAPQNYFAKVIRDVMKHRRQTGERWDDFLQLMLDAQQGLLKMDEDTNEVMNGSTETNVLNETADKQNKISFDDEDIIANCMLFMLGGFDTTQSLLLFAVYELAKEQRVQDKVYSEVKAAFDANNGKLTYDAVQEMQYMDLFLNETLRFYPPAPRTERCCTKDYILPDTNTVIEKGTIIGIPIYPIHHDAKHFDNPYKFEPERFLPDRKASRHPIAFMSFGHGPRNCIGMRFALTEVKAVIARLVYTFKLTQCSKTNVPIEFDSNSNLKPKGGMWLQVTPRT